MNSKNCIIEPLTCLCKLALLNFLPERTKLKICNNILVIQEPYLFGWIFRTMEGDSKEDIQFLHQPIQRVIEWYINVCDKNAEMSVDIKKAIIDIANYALKGLKKLQNTYATGNVTLAIQYFIIIINQAINNNIIADNMYTLSEPSNITISNEIKCNFEEIINIRNMMDQASKTTSEVHKNNYIEFIKGSLNIRDENFRKIMVEINTKI